MHQLRVAKRRYGSIATDLRWLGNVRFTPVSDRIVTLRQPPLGPDLPISADILPPIDAGLIPGGPGLMAIGIGRRQFLSALGSAVVAWPPVVRTQQPILHGLISPPRN